MSVRAIILGAATGVFILGNFKTTQAASGPGHGGKILPQKGQVFVEEPSQIYVDRMIHLSPREREIRGAENPSVVEQFGARANQRGIEGLRLSIEIYSPTPLTPAWSALTFNHQKLMEEELYAFGAKALLDAGVFVLGSGARVQTELNPPPAASQIPWMQPRRPFLGEGVLTKPTPPGSRPPGAEVRPNAPDLNKLIVSVELSPFSDHKAGLVVRAAFERPLKDYRYPDYGHFTPATVWQGVDHHQEVNWPPVPGEICPMVEAAIREWLVALGYAAPSPEKLTDAARLPGLHREGIYEPGSGKMAPWDETKEMLPWSIQGDKPWLGMDNFLCDGAGRRWNPLDEKFDPCARYPKP